MPPEVAIGAIGRVQVFLETLKYISNSFNIRFFRQGSSTLQRKRRSGKGIDYAGELVC